MVKCCHFVIYLCFYRFNLKRQLDGLEIIAEDAFEAMLNADDQLDEVSLSGSDSEDEVRDLEEEDEEDFRVVEKQRDPKVFFQNGDGDLMAVKKVALIDKNKEDLNDEEFMQRIKETKAKRCK